MIYVVSGYRRSGTSMMMRALYHAMTEGEVLYAPSHENLNEVHEGYIPNPDGLFEVGQPYYMIPSFLRKLPDGSLIKILFDGLPHLPKGSWKIIFMERDPEEIMRSVERVEQHLASTGKGVNPANCSPFDVFRPYRRDDIDHVLGICEMRQDIDLVQVNYRDVIEHPVEVFRSLDMPLDVEKAAGYVNPEFYRFRREINEHRSHGDEGTRAESSRRRSAG